jgi:hypothetical protein
LRLFSSAACRNNPIASTWFLMRNQVFFARRKSIGQTSSRAGARRRTCRNCASISISGATRSRRTLPHRQDDLIDRGDQSVDV